MEEGRQFSSALIHFASNLLTRVLYQILFLSAVLCRHIHYLGAHQSRTSSSLFSRGTLVQNPSQSETVQFVLHSTGDTWHWVTHVNYNCCCYAELFRRLERFRPAKHKQWDCTCLLSSSERWIQHFGFWLHIILACRIILHFKQACNVTLWRPGDRSQVMWNFWWTEWQWGGFSLVRISLFRSNSHSTNCSIFINHPISRRYIVSILTASLVGSEDLTAMVIKICISWDITGVFEERIASIFRIEE
jgi:hypothetical protein